MKIYLASSCAPQVNHWTRSREYHLYPKCAESGDSVNHRVGANCDWSMFGRRINAPGVFTCEKQ